MTVTERRALAVFRPGIRWSPDALASATSTSAHGAARTASSLVRKGELVRVRDRGSVWYRLPELGEVAS